MGDGLGGLRGSLNQMRFGEIERQIAELKRIQADVTGDTYERLQRGQPVSRARAAQFLGVSTKRLQRMEAAGKLKRCPDLGAVVLYAARDVLRLASASSTRGA